MTDSNTNSDSASASGSAPTSPSAPSSDSGQDGFIEGPGYTRPPSEKGRLNLDLANYEGPLDVLLSLARLQKVDLAQISIFELAEQYIAFIDEARHLQIEIAADYLVMAAWLAYLKSRLLLPPPEEEEEPSAEELAARIAFQLQRLEAMREAAAQLMARDQLGRDIFARRVTEGIRIKRHSKYDANLHELLASYSTQKLRQYYSSWTPPKLPIISIERARLRWERIVGKLQDWARFEHIVLEQMKDRKKRRTLAASSFGAMLEFVRDGRIEIRQEKNWGEIFVRRARPKPADNANIGNE
ncbi:MAG: ScpA family protein [Alphaproteobacteria bacterium]|nr:ScpA family protein [Alphaproteobacteria bacterium]